MTTYLLGIDTGGTFTDFVYSAGSELTVHKVLSTPDNPALAIKQGIQDMGLLEDIKSGRVRVVIGTTVATNALLEGTGVPTAYITNVGMKDILKIGRQTRLDLYSLKPRKLETPIEDSLLFEISGRHDSLGEEIYPLEDSELISLKKAVDSKRPMAIAINLLFSFINDAHEKKIEALFSKDYFVSRSSEILPERNEYERGITTWINAWLGPLINDYILKLISLFTPSSISVMQSNVTTIAANQAAKRAANLVLSGPAGGLSAAQLFQTENLISFDMGGTSTDVSLITNGIRLRNDSVIGHFPLALPMADIHTIGAGGGSIAFIDRGGLLQVGPESAGATPGPACYGLGGKRPTVTDANLILGRLVPETFLDGTIRLNLKRAVEALSPLAKELSLSIQQVALGIVQIANENMIQALRHISVQRGFDPSNFKIICFGGAGGLHVCELAEAMNIKQAIIPTMSGVLSALGMIVTNPGRELVKTYCRSLDSVTRGEIQTLYDELMASGLTELQAEGVRDVNHLFSMDLRYLGQTSTIRIPFSNFSRIKERFKEAHQSQFGHTFDLPIELLNLRLRLEAKPLDFKIPAIKTTIKPSLNRFVNLPEVGKSVPMIFKDSLAPRQKLLGPALISDRHSTALVRDNWGFEVDEAGTLLLNSEA